MTAPSVRLVAAAAGLALLGDSLLYVVLPIEGKHLGLTAAQVGALLAGNRLLRIVLNEPARWLLVRAGARAALVLALVLAASSTAAYAVAARAFVPFLVARLAWGLAWSLIRHAANEAVLANPAGDRGALQGAFRGISRVGSLGTVILGARLVEAVGFERGYLLLGLATTPGVWLAWRAFAASSASARPPEPAPAGVARGLVAVGVASFLVSAAGSSLLVATASLRLEELLSPAREAHLLGHAVPLLTLAGIAGSGRWIAEILAAPAAGRLADARGRAPVVIAGGLASAAALAACALASGPGSFVLASLAAFVALAVLQTGLDALATDAASASSGKALAQLGRYAIVVDAATGIGPYVGPSLPASFGLGPTYLAAAGIALAVALAGRLLAAPARR